MPNHARGKERDADHDQEPRGVGLEHWAPPGHCRRSERATESAAASIGSHRSALGAKHSATRSGRCRAAQVDDEVGHVIGLGEFAKQGGGLVHLEVVLLELLQGRAAGLAVHPLTDRAPRSHTVGRHIVRGKISATQRDRRITAAFATP